LAGNFGNWWYVGSASGHFWSGFDPANPLKKTKQWYIADDINSPQTWEALFTLEREIVTDLAVSIGASYRRYTDYEMELWYYPDTGYKRTAADFVEAGTIPATVGGKSTLDAAGRPYYLLKAGIAYTDFRLYGNRPDYYTEHMGVDLIFNKRLSHKWMLYGTATLQTQKRHFGGPNSMLDGWDLTNKWVLDGGLYAPWAGAASGKPSQYNFSHWMVKLNGLYQLPFDINCSFIFNAREGFPNYTFFSMQNTAWPNANNRSVEVGLIPFGKRKLSNYWNLDLRVEKLVRSGDFGRIYFMVDGMNIFNDSTIIRRYLNNLGTYNDATGTLVPYALDSMANEIHNPRVFRLGIRFTF
jgi:hypothetical protein